MLNGLLTIGDLDEKMLNDIFALSARLKRQRGAADYKPLRDKVIAMIFAKSSTRTRVSFETGIHELGGHAMYLEQGKMQVGRGETMADTARVMGRYVHGIVIRTYDHQDVVDLAKYSGIPVINALTDMFHPCQVLADLFTMREYSGNLTGLKLAYVGDGCCNMANSLMLGAKLSGMELVISSPEEFKPNLEIFNRRFGTGKVSWEKDPVKAVANADYIYTDVWVSMGFEAETEKRLKLLSPYQVNAALVAAASLNVRILHCLPAHRGEEITDDVMDSERSIVFDQAENRLHVQKAIMAMIFDKGLDI